MTQKRPDNHRPIAYVLMKKYGIRGAWQILRDDLGFDLRHGVNTAAPVSRSRLFPKGQRDEQNRYVASTFGVINGVLDYVSSDLKLEDCGFVDLGSGKGKALIGASRFPFRSIRGVDVSPRVHDIATANLRKLGLEAHVNLILGSAAELELLPHERVLYFFNSFTGDILERCLENIASSARDAPGIMIYVNPTEARQVQGHFSLLRSDFLQPGNCEVAYFALP